MTAVRAGSTVLLFFREYETDRFIKYDRYLKRLARPLYGRITKRQIVYGFGRWFQSLRIALEHEGFDVRVNDWRTAKANPLYPVGLVGYPHLLDSYRLANPAVLGPALFDHPSQAPSLMDDARFRYYLVTCEWMQDLFAPTYGDRCVRWYAGIDLEQWPVRVESQRDVDVIVYDKVRWNRDTLTPNLIDPILAELDRNQLSREVVRYGDYDLRTYRKLLGRAKSMVFLCEHETQGMAYQEALASDVPVLAWDQGWWLDPRRPEYTTEQVPATSVPFFSSACGERFQDAESFPAALKTFQGRLGEYRPREYIATELSLPGSAEKYAQYYFSLLPDTSIGGSRSS